MSEETVFYFGKNNGKKISDVPSGYLRWCCENIDPVPLPKDRAGKTVEEVKAMEDRMRNFLSAIEDELNERDES